MNKRQKAVGWFFCSLIAFILLASEQIVLGLSLIGVWSFIMAGTKSPASDDPHTKLQNRRALKWTPGMVAAIEEASRTVMALPQSQKMPAIVRFASDMVETWGSQWIEDWLRSQDLSSAEVSKVVTQWNDFPVLSDDDSAKIFEAAVVLKVLGRID